MADETPARYLVHIRLFPPPYSEETVQDRVREAAPIIRDTLDRLAHGEIHLAYLSEGGETIGMFLKSTADPHAIRTAVQESRAFRAHDHILVLELGGRFSAVGNNAGWEWLQHH